jgi:hypothetical protein
LVEGHIKSYEFLSTLSPSQGKIGKSSGFFEIFNLGVGK